MGNRWRVSMGDFVRMAISQDVLRLLEQEPMARVFEPEGIHHLRTSTRRLRSNLKFFEAVLNPEWEKPIRDELKWLGGVLGHVRDLDVLEGHLLADFEASDAETLDSEEQGRASGRMQRLIGRIESEKQEARAVLEVEMNGERYAALRRRLIEGARFPELGEDANRAAHSALPKMLGRHWRRFLKRMMKLEPDAPTEAFHTLRKDAKRIRYAAEAVSLAPDAKLQEMAKRIVKFSTKTQDILGALQDAVVEADFLKKDDAGHDNGSGAPASANRLLDMQEQKTISAKADFLRHRDRMETIRLSE